MKMNNMLSDNINVSEPADQDNPLKTGHTDVQKMVQNIEETKSEVVFDSNVVESPVDLLTEVKAESTVDKVEKSNFFSTYSSSKQESRQTN